MRALVALIAVAAIVAAVTAGSSAHDRPAAPQAAAPAPPTRAPSSTAPVPPRLERRAINRQDRSSRAQREREARVYDSRPLLGQLPLELADVRIDLAGLHGDGHTTLLSVDPGPRGRAFARRLYRRALATFGDPGTAYRLRWRP